MCTAQVAAHVGASQHTATHCNALQHTATHCNTLQHKAHVVAQTLPYWRVSTSLHHTTTHSNTPQRTAIHCNTPQHTATHSARRRTGQRARAQVDCRNPSIRGGPLFGMFWVQEAAGTEPRLKTSPPVGDVNRGGSGWCSSRRSLLRRGV